MSQAFYTAMSGINSAQTQINVVADNVANLNTTGYKESLVTFQDIFYTTQSSGSGSTTENGGVNPKQVGLGVQVGTIDRNFDQGTVVTTGRSLDMDIQGTGFFCVQNSGGEIQYTRAGTFSVDDAGNLVNPSGYKLMGAESLLANSCGENPIHIPTMIITETVPNTDDIGTKDLKDLNNIQLTTGDFKIRYYQSDTTGGADPGWKDLTVTLDPNNTNNMNNVITQINTAIQTQAPNSNIVATLNNGGVKFTMNKAATGDIETTQLQFISGSSNFVAESEIASAAKQSDGTTNGSYSTKTLDFKQEVKPPDIVSNAVSYSGVSVSQDGKIEITYSNGDKLSVDQDSNGVSIFKYTTADNVIIKGTDVLMNPNVLEKPNLQVQLARFVNQNGLKGVGSNTYVVGPNCGDITYGTADANAFGGIKTGCLEGSNVDLSRQFSNMITAQRAIESNSRVFNTANQIMQTLVYMGQ